MLRTWQPRSVTTYDPAPVEPVPGDPDELDAMAGRCHRAAAALRADLALLHGAGSVPSWSGEAARAFAASVRDLPRDVRRAADSFETVGRVLTVFAGELRGAQRRARWALAECEHLDGQLRAGRPLYPAGGIESLTPEGMAAEAWRRAELAAARETARRALAVAGADAAAAAERAARQVVAASDAPHDRAGLFARMVDGVGDWVADNAAVLARLSGTLAALSGVLGLLAMVPGLAAVCGPAAVVVGVTALVIDAALASRGQARWRDVAVSGLLLVVPARGRGEAAPAMTRGRSRLAQEGQTRWCG